MSLTEINIKEKKTDRFWSVSIDPFYEPGNEQRGHKSRIGVSCERGFGPEEWVPATVGWFSIGSVSAIEADGFQKALATAVEYAKRMNDAHGIQ